MSFGPNGIRKFRVSHRTDTGLGFFMIASSGSSILVPHSMHGRMGSSLCTLEPNQNRGSMRNLTVGNVQFLRTKHDEKFINDYNPYFHNVQGVIKLKFIFGSLQHIQLTARKVL